MTNRSLFNRRFIRIKATTNLYAYYIRKQANYEVAVTQIQDDFMPHTFAEPAVDPIQLAQGKELALALFSTCMDTTQTTIKQVHHPNTRVEQAVKRALASYEQAVLEDFNRLKKGLHEAKEKSYNASLQILKLFIAWSYVAKQQTKKQKQPPVTLSTCLAHNRILQQLQNNQSFCRLVQKKAISWAVPTPLVADWYNEFVKNDLHFQGYLTQPTILEQDEQLLVYLTKSIIFNNEVIQDFFNDLDLHWIENKYIVKGIVLQTLASLKRNAGKNDSLAVFEQVAPLAEETHFYTDLVARTLEKEKDYEALIAPKIKKWTLNRMALLDKIIIKLALCELLHFMDIPTKVSINEYIDIAKMYSTAKSSQFVNGVLDTLTDILYKQGLLIKK